MGQFFKIGALAFAGALLAATPPALAGGHFGGVHMGGVHYGAGMVPARPVGTGVRPNAVYRPHMAPGVRAPAVTGYRPGFYAGNRAVANGYRRGYYGANGQQRGYYNGYAYPFTRYYGAGYRRGYYGGGYGGLGYGGTYYNGVYGAWPAVGAAIVLPMTTVYDDYPPYPVGYNGASYTPTGNGVIYNLPLTPERLGPKIIYVSGHHHAHGCKGRHHLTVIRGGEVSCE
ncbi:hypothetical protein K9U39_05100 [Rhodoblastus acidophilus]|uniref:Uncharacterized protein n=1 Tax=Candidatus Rhodoblastus alkanivorans TaxID=2954117 RepID=A0ABS9Z5S4_9HYPH|nr:hypothetical protein [Candidatus Rhodoblastus alkanivorans]MCI4678609.1 hypothetical protein [Candidatus Rhodoblastus alkanivorans]MCI4683019.1 hypothetical protein [Candidatus Rhodoblastus alkanivorans]MDI4640329.1 hypothetical protein [Rhodoblastus acidophilus]